MEYVSEYVGYLCCGIVLLALLNLLLEILGISIFGGERKPGFLVRLILVIALAIGLGWAYENVIVDLPQYQQLKEKLHGSVDEMAGDDEAMEEDYGPVELDADDEAMEEDAMAEDAMEEDAMDGDAMDSADEAMDDAGDAMDAADDAMGDAEEAMGDAVEEAMDEAVDSMMDEAEGAAEEIIEEATE